MRAGGRVSLTGGEISRGEEDLSSLNELGGEGEREGSGVDVIGPQVEYTDSSSGMNGGEMSLHSLS